MTSPFVIVTLLGSVIVTAFISGIFGMAGGMILMGVMAWLLPVQKAMILHGITQLTSNGWRAIIHRQHITWHILGQYILGVLLCLLPFAYFTFVADKVLVFIVLGILPFLAPLAPKDIALDILKPGRAVFCGFLVTSFQLTAGVSGPMLDIFFVKTSLNRHQIVATKAFTQTFGHFFKLVYFGFIVSTPMEAFGGLPYWIYLCVIPLAMVGTSLGKHILHKLTDKQFLNWTQIILMIIGGVYIAKAASLAFAG